MKFKYCGIYVEGQEKEKGMYLSLRSDGLDIVDEEGGVVNYLIHIHPNGHLQLVGNVHSDIAEMLGAGLDRHGRIVIS